jgi:hypothetical protein
MVITFELPTTGVKVVVDVAGRVRISVPELTPISTVEDASALVAVTVISALGYDTPAV